MFSSLSVEEVHMLATGLGLLALVAAVVMGLYWYFSNKKDKQVSEFGVLPSPKKNTTPEADENIETEEVTPAFSFKSAVGDHPVEEEPEPHKRGFFKRSSTKGDKKPKAKKEKAVKGSKFKKGKESKNNKQTESAIESQALPTPTDTPPRQPVTPVMPPRLQLRRPEQNTSGPAPTTAPTHAPQAQGDPQAQTTPQRTVPQLKRPTVFQDVNKDEPDW